MQECRLNDAGRENAETPEGLKPRAPAASSAVPAPLGSCAVNPEP